MSWLLKPVTAAINAERASNGLEPIDVETLLNAATIEAACDSIRISRDDWTLYLGFDVSGLTTFPPANFDPRYHFPRCPLTGSLYDSSKTRVASCDHAWERKDDVEQCWKCREGRPVLNIHPITGD